MQTLKKWSPEGWGPERWGPEISRYFFPLPPQFSFFSHSLLVFFVEFWWCLKRRGAQMCTFGVLGLSCASPPAARSGGAAGGKWHINDDLEQKMPSGSRELKEACGPPSSSYRSCLTDWANVPCVPLGLSKHWNGARLMMVSVMNEP